MNTYTLKCILVLILQLTYWLFQGECLNLSVVLKDKMEMLHKTQLPLATSDRAKHDILWTEAKL